MRSRVARGRLLRFGEFEFDAALGELRREGVALALTPQARRLLRHLLANRGRALSRDALLDAVWPDVVVSYGALNTAIYELRCALGDDGRRQHTVRTVRKEGFSFVAPVEEVTAGGPGLEPASRVDAPFVGRAQLLERLHGVLGTVARGEGAVVLLAGEAGMGKTCLAERLVRAASAFQPCSGRCYEHAGAPPFWPWIQVLREALEESRPNELSRLFASAGARPGAPRDATRRPATRFAGNGATPAEARFQLFDRIAGLLRERSVLEPLLLVLEDVHFADPSSLLLLEFLAAELSRSPVLLLATYRPEELGDGHPLAATITTMARLPHCERWALPPLAAHEVVELMAAMLGTEPAEAAVRDVVRRSEGNPLFVKELVRQLGTPDEPAPASGDPAGGLPQQVAASIRRRMARLSATTQQALGVAAVLGRDFRIDLVARVWDGDGPLDSGWIEEAARAHVVTLGDAGPGRARFAHALFLEVLYDGLGRARRGDLHRRAGEALEVILAAPAGPDLAALAHHFGEASLTGAGTTKAVRYAVAAAREASEMLAYEAAAEHFAAALRALESVPDADVATSAELLVCLGEAQDQAGEPARARGSFLRAAAAARRCAHPEILARAALGYATAREQWLRFDGVDRDREARRHGDALLEEALRALGDGDPALRARVMATLAVEGRDLDPAERNRLSQAALAIADTLDQPALAAEVVGALRDVLWSPDNVHVRLAMADTIAGLAARTGEGELELRGRAWRLTDLLELGETEQVRCELAVLDRMSRDVGQLRIRHHVVVLHATLAILDGRFADAEQFAGDALAIGRRLRSEIAEAVYLVQMVTMRREQGRLAEVEETLRAIAALFPMSGFRSVLAFVLGEMERLPEARSIFEGIARHGFADVPRDRNFLATLALLTEVCGRLGDRERAAMLYDLLLPFADRNLVCADGLVSGGGVAHHLGVVAAVLGRWEDAEQHFEAGLRHNVRVGARAFLGQVQRAYGEMLLERGALGDRARGLASLEAALATARRFGSHGLRRRVLAVIEREERRAPAHRSGRPRRVAASGNGPSA